MAQVSLVFSGTPAACGQDISATGFLTTYQYDALDNLLQVNQGNLDARTFTYDSLSQLVTSANPESGLTTYTYDANGNTASRTQPEANQTDASDTVTTTYVHDALDRLTAKEYSDDTGNVDYNYDETSPWGFTLTNTNGRLTTEYDGNTGSVFSYDAMGRILQNHQCTPQNCGTADFPIAYTYDLDGDMLTSTDGQLNLYTRTYNNAAELISLVSSYSDSNHPGTLYSSAVHNAPGQLTSVLLGNGITESRAYNSRLEMTSASAGSVYSLGLGYAPNGDMTSTTDSVNGTWTYSYDDFNRLIGSSCSATCPDGESTQGFSYSYDRFANRWDQTVTAGSGGTSSLTFTGNDNQIDGYSYDAAGNLMSDGSHTYYYDAEHHLVQVDGTEGWCQSDTGTAATACYTYDAEGRRVRRSVPGVGDTDDYLYDLSGHFITQMSSQGTWVRGEIYAAGEHIATYENDLTTPTTFFTHSDHLGTERVQTAVNGSSCETITNTAFGDGMNETGSCDPTALRFTDKLRDYETNLDDFGARFYSSQLGRFMSADWSAVPAPVPYANLSNPQTLNLYAIVADNPETFADLDGHCGGDTAATSACSDPFGTDTGTPSAQKATQQKTGVGADATSATQTAVQLVKDTLVGGLKGAVNQIIDTSNAINHVVDSALSAAGSKFQFGQLPDLKASTSGQASAMLAVTVAAVAAPVGADAKAGTLLSKSLASDAQMGEKGIAIAGSGSGTELRDAGRLASQYGGNPGDWAKMSSSSFQAAGEPRSKAFQTHWYENAVTGARAEYKTMINWLDKNFKP